MESGSFARGSQPQSVPDSDAEGYAKAMRQQGDTNALRESELERRRAETIRRDKLLGDRLFSFAEPEAEQ
jgi:hypothetical protein